LEVKQFSEASAVVTVRIREDRGRGTRHMSMAAEAIEEPGGTAAAPPFRQKLALVIVDKLVLGLLIVLAGFALNMVLERYRTEAALQNEFAKVRVEKVAEVWNVLQDQEENLRAFQTVFVNLNDSTDLRKAELRRLSEQFVAGETEFQQILMRNQFWLNDDLKETLGAYAIQQHHVSESLIDFPKVFERLEGLPERDVEEAYFESMDTWLKTFEKAVKDWRVTRLNALDALGALIE
jgi:hypothetical protein